MSSTSPNLSFDRATYEGDPPAPDQCAYCHRGIVLEYFRVGGHMACSVCANQAHDLVPPDSHRAYMRALMFGSAAALAGCLGYALISMTGIMVGFVAIGVGWLIGKAMHAGSRGRGGRRYQITAVLLTYAAISMSVIPVAIRDLSQRPETRQTSTAQPSDGATGASVGNDALKRPSLGRFLTATGMIFGIGLISPFLELAASIGHGVLTLFFLFIGMQAAWKLTRKTEVAIEGPFESTQPTSLAG